MALTDPLQWIVIAVVAIVFLMMGPKKIPELARSLGLARQEFQAVSQGVKETTGKLQNPDALLASLTAEPRPTIQPRATPPAATVKSGDDILLDTARKLGISTDGKTKEQISQEIMNKANPTAAKQ